MRSASPEYLARRFVGWWVQGHACHQLLRHLHHDAQIVEYPGDGTVLVRVDAAAWLASESAAADPPPEPLTGPASATNGTSTTRNGNSPRDARSAARRTTPAATSGKTASSTGKTSPKTRTPRNDNAPSSR